MKGKQIFLHYKSSRPLIPLVVGRRTCLYNPSKWLSQGSEEGHGHAPSLAEEFKRVAEEKSNVEEAARAAAEQGITSQTIDAASHAAEEAALGNGNVESVKKRMEEHEPGKDYRRRGD